MGLSMFLGGLKYKEREFKPIVAQVSGSSMTLAVIAILLPTMAFYSANKSDAFAIEKLSIAVAIILIIVYAMTLLFSLKTHSYLYEVGLVDLDVETTRHKPDLQLWLVMLVLVGYTLGQPMDLNFNPFEVVAVAVAVIVANLISLDGRSKSIAIDGFKVAFP